MVAQVDASVDLLSLLSNVPDAYRHHQRLITPGADLSLPQAHLKWYEIRRMLVPIPPELVQECRDFLREEAEAGRLGIEHETGFVMLHLGDGPSGPNTYFMLMILTWRNANELWQTVYNRDLANRDGFHRPTFERHAPSNCVWELAPIWHERQAWNRYLYTNRDEDAMRAYLDDRYAGLA